MSKKIIITGGLGYIGTELCKLYSGVSWHHKITVIDSYSFLNFLANAQTKIVILDVSAGVGLSSTSIGDEISKPIMTIVVDAAYDIPVQIGPISSSLFFRAQESLGVPGQEAGTSDIIGFGLSINYSMSN